MTQTAIVELTTTNDDEEFEFRQVALVILSTVARLQGQRGISAVVDVMRGTPQASLVEAGLDELGVYGMLDWIAGPRLRALVEVLIEAGLIARGSKQVLGLTAAGAAVMTGEVDLPKATERTMGRAFYMVTPDTPSKRYGSRCPTLDATRELLERGMSVEEIASYRGLSPSTIIDHTIALVCRGAPIQLEGEIDGEVAATLKEVACDWAPGDPIAPVRRALGDDSMPWTRLVVHLLHNFQRRRA